MSDKLDHEVKCVIEYWKGRTSKYSALSMETREVMQEMIDDLEEVIDDE